ncbi:hypothetical protein BHM03_00053512 [Ensete ventricosum]|nr:hypothetical protein BHM03_00053512 [Ensete ventricosum]
MKLCGKKEGTSCNVMGSILQAQPAISANHSHCPPPPIHCSNPLLPLPAGLHRYLPLLPTTVADPCRSNRPKRRGACCLLPSVVAVLTTATRCYLPPSSPLTILAAAHRSPSIGRRLPLFTSALSLGRLFLRRPPLFFSSRPPSPLLINHRQPNPCHCRHRPALCRNPRRTLLPCRCQSPASLLSSPRKSSPSLLPPIAPSRALLCRTPRCCLPPVPPCHCHRLALGSVQPAVTRPSPLPPLPQRCRAQQRCCCCLPATLSRYRSPRRTAATLFLPPLPAAAFTAPFALLTLPACRSSAAVATPSSAAQPPLPSLLPHLPPPLLPCFLLPLLVAAAFLLNRSLTCHVVASLSPAPALTAANRLCPPLADADNLVTVKSYYIYNICP